MNNVRLEIEKAETIPYILSDDVSPSGVFKGNNDKYYFYSVIGTENYNVYLFESTNTIDWTRVGRAQIIDPPANLLNINSLNGAVGFTTATYNGISYVLLLVGNAAANISDNNTDYGINDLDVAVLHYCEINLDNPINVNYGGRIRFGYMSGGTFVPSYQKMDSKPSLFFDSYKNKWFITGRKRTTKTGDIITWHNPSDNGSHIGTGIDNTVQEYTGPATGCEVPTNRRSLNIFEGPTTLTTGVNDFAFSQSLNPEDATFYNYNPKNINSTSHLKYPTIKPDFQWGAAQAYEKRFLINMSTYFKDDRRATINIIDNVLSSTRLDRREGPLQPVILYSRKGVDFNLVQEKIESGTYTGQPDFYKTYLKDEDFASISNVALSTTNYYRNHAPYTTGDNPIPASEIRQAYPSEFYVDGENLYCTIFSRGYSHYEGGIVGQEPWAHRVRIVKLKKDRFFGWKATNSNAYITTKLMSVDSAINYINVNAKGSFKVQLLNANDSSLGYLTISNNDTFTSDEDEINKYIPLPTRAYNEFKLRFHLLTTNTKLFAFRFYYPNNLTNIPDPDVVNDVIPAPILVSPINGQNVPESGTLLTFQQSNGFVVSSVISGVNTFNRYRIDWTNNLSYFEPDVNGNYPSIPSGFGSTVFRVASSINEITGYMEVSRGFGGYSGETAYWRVRAEEIIDSANNIINYGEWSQVQSFTIT